MTAYLRNVCGWCHEPMLGSHYHDEREPADDDIDPICGDCNGTGSTPDVYGDAGPCRTCNVYASCDDCAGSGRAITGLPEDEPTYWSDIADGVGSEDCETCGTTGMVATVYAD